MFERLQPIINPVRIRFEDQDITAESGDTVAAALLSSGVLIFRESTGSNNARGPFCMIGNCFECLVEIDGVPNIQACQERVRDGMLVRIQCGITRFEVDGES